MELHGELHRLHCVRADLYATVRYGILAVLVLLLDAGVLKADLRLCMSVISLLITASFHSAVHRLSCIVMANSSYTLFPAVPFLNCVVLFVLFAARSYKGDIDRVNTLWRSADLPFGEAAGGRTVISLASGAATLPMGCSVTARPWRGYGRCGSGRVWLGWTFCTAS
jgi:hypothetical protein